MKENKNNTTNTAIIDFQSRESAERVEAIVKASQLSQLYTTSYTYSISEADNRVIKGKNRISVLNEEQSRAERIIKTLKLDSSHDATSRIEVWVDKTQIVVYVGASFNVSARLAKKQNEELFKSFSELHAQSRDMKWRYAQSCETRHKFNTFESFETFYNQLSELVSLQLTAEKEAQKKAEEQKAQQKSTEQKKEEQKSTAKQKSKKQTKQKEQKAKEA